MSVEVSLDNISLFNDVYYKDCFYNPFFTLLKSHKRSIIPYLRNEIFYYGPDTTCGDMNLTVLSEVKESLYNLLVKDSITTEFYEPVNLIFSVENEIKRGNQIMLLVDHFELPHSASYKTHHAAHFLLVYGYNNSTSTFYIVDNQSNRGSFLAKIKYIDLFNSYYSCIRNCFNSNLKFQVFSQKNNLYRYRDKTDSSFNAYNLEEKEKIENGLVFLKEYTIRFSSFVSDPISLKNSIEKVWDFGFMYFYIRTYKSAEYYRNLKLFNIDSSINQLMYEVIDSWKLIRTILEKYIASLLYSEKDCKFITQKINLIYHNESKYYDYIFNGVKE